MTRIRLLVAVAAGAMLAPAAHADRRTDLLTDGEWTCEAAVHDGSKAQLRQTYGKDGSFLAFVSTGFAQGGKQLMFDATGKGAWTLSGETLTTNVSEATLQKVTVDGTPMSDEALAQAASAYAAHPPPPSDETIVELTANRLELVSKGTRTVCRRGGGAGF